MRAPDDDGGGCDEAEGVKVDVGGDDDGRMMEAVAAEEEGDRDVDGGGIVVVRGDLMKV